MQIKMPGDGRKIDPNTRDIAGEVLGDDGRLKILPAAYWATTTPEERFLFGQHYGYYSRPTTELVDWLREHIGERKTIEIGAGNGMLAETLGITATDSMQQNRADMQRMYALLNHATVRYGPNVQKYDAKAAVRKFRPSVVLGCWVTHKWSSKRPGARGNEHGVDEEDVLYNCAEYIFVGNEHVHQVDARKPIWDRPHEIIYPDWLYSRAVNGTREFIATWCGRKLR